jgi:hypothetical protein
MSEIYANSPVSVENIDIDTKDVGECVGGVCPVDYEEPAEYMRDSTILGSETSYNASGEESLSGSVELGATEQAEASETPVEESPAESPEACRGQCEGCPCQETDIPASPEDEDVEMEDAVREESVDDTAEEEVVEEEDEETASVMYVVMEDDMPVAASASHETANTHLNSMVSDTVIKYMPDYNVYTSMDADGVVSLFGSAKNLFYRWCSKHLASFKIVEVPYM